MDIPVDVYMVCPDGPFGFLNSIVLNPKTNEVTHLVVDDDKKLGRKWLVPINKIVKSTFRYILVGCTLCELSEFMPSESMTFLSVDSSNNSVGELLKLNDCAYDSQAYAAATPNYLKEEQIHIPVNEIAVRGGSQVFAIDGKVGVLDELVIAPDNHRITDMIVRIGYFWGYKDVDIPLTQIDQISDDAIRLKLSKSMVVSLPMIADTSDQEG